MRRYFSCLLPSDLLVGFEMDAQEANTERSRFAPASARRKHAPRFRRALLSVAELCSLAEVKKQHQAGWGEGDKGEERLGQFYRLKALRKGDE